jgi:KaiC
MEFLVRGATQYNEPGVFMAFEETAPELTQNVRSLGFDLDELAKQKKLVIDFVRIERSEIDETGDYDLEGLFIRLGSPSTELAPGASFSTPSKIFLPDCRIKGSCAPNCGASFDGSKTGALLPSSLRNAAKALLPATAWRNTFRTA